MRIGPSHFLALLLVTLLPASNAFADGEARFSTSNPDVPALTFSWRGDQHSRLDSPGQPAHVIAIDGQAWGVTSVAGQPVAMDLESLSRILGPDSGLDHLGPGSVVPARLTALEATGRTERVAGITGEVYRVSWEDNHGQARMSEAVFTDHALVREMQSALVDGMAAAIARRGNIAGPEQAYAELRHRGLAVLRFSDAFRLESIEGSEQPGDPFMLPRRPIDLRQMMRGMMGG